jgi:hypothetical protein
MTPRKLLVLFALFTGALVGLHQAHGLLNHVPLPGQVFLQEREETRRRGAALDADIKLLLDSTAITQQVRDDLIAGRLSLRQALSALKAEDARRPPHLRRRLCPYVSGRTPEERYARGLVQQLKRDQPYTSVFAARLAEIEKELEQYLADEERNARTAPAIYRAADLLPATSRTGCR